MTVCPGCGVRPGERHRPGCTWAQCPYCGDHLADCGHEPPLDDRLPWTGYDFWLDACLELGLFKKQTARGWVACKAYDAGSLPDVGRLIREFRWSRAEKKFDSWGTTRREGPARPPRSSQ
jgi:hypothetical protein